MTTLVLVKMPRALSYHMYILFIRDRYRWINSALYFRMIGIDRSAGTTSSHGALRLRMIGIARSLAHFVFV